MIKPNYILIPLLVSFVAGAGSYAANLGLLPQRGLDFSWYDALLKPSFQPPDAAFGIVWTTLFALAAFSLLIVWNTSPRDRRLWWTIGVFVGNAVLNVLWSFLFFGWHLIGAAVLDAVALALSTLVLVLLILPRSRLAAFLLVPYLLWVSFAAYLTYAILVLNR